MHRASSHSDHRGKGMHRGLGCSTTASPKTCAKLHHSPRLGQPQRQRLQSEHAHLYQQYFDLFLCLVQAFHLLNVSPSVTPSPYQSINTLLAALSESDSSGLNAFWTKSITRNRCPM